MGTVFCHSTREGQRWLESNFKMPLFLVKPQSKRGKAAYDSERPGSALARSCVRLLGGSSRRLNGQKYSARVFLHREKDGNMILAIGSHLFFLRCTPHMRIPSVLSASRVGDSGLQLSADECHLCCYIFRDPKVERFHLSCR